MPTYDYDCPNCGGFDALRPIADRDQPSACPDCGKASPRVLTAAPRLALLGGDLRQALDRNERARHEPMSSKAVQPAGHARLKHPSGCGCCASRHRRPGTLTAGNGAKMFTGRRPWMISH